MSRWASRITFSTSSELTNFDERSAISISKRRRSSSSECVLLLSGLIESCSHPRRRARAASPPQTLIYRPRHNTGEERGVATLGHHSCRRTAHSRVAATGSIFPEPAPRVNVPQKSLNCRILLSPARRLESGARRPFQAPGSPGRDVARPCVQVVPTVWLLRLLLGAWEGRVVPADHRRERHYPFVQLLHRLQVVHNCRRAFLRSQG